MLCIGPKEKAKKLMDKMSLDDQYDHYEVWVVWALWKNESLKALVTKYYKRCSYSSNILV